MQEDENLQQVSDDALLARIGDGDRRAGTELVRRHLSYVHYVCRSKLGDVPEAEEAAQDVFASVWKNAGNWQPGGAKVTSWLYRIAANRCIDILRRRRPTTDADAIAEPADERADVEAAQHAADRHRLISQALQTLSDDQKQAVELVYYREVKQADAAEMLGLSLAALESVLRRARAKLHQQLAAQREHLEMV